MPSSRREAWLSPALALIGVAYPLIVWFGMGRIPSSVLVMLALGLLLLRRGSAPAGLTSLPLTVAAALQVLLLLQDADLAALAWPVLMSSSFAAAFAISLVRPPTLVERFAALHEPDPSPAARRYMRQVTAGWALLLTANAALSAWTALFADLDTWMLYNGLLSYLILGSAMAVELLIRRRVRAREEAPG